MPEPVRSALRRLGRRLAIGLFLEVWPRWAVVSLVVAGVSALICRMFVAAAAPALPWLWLAPLLAAAPVLAWCFMRAYRPAEVVALADWLGGGHGTLLTLHEQEGEAWAMSSQFDDAVRFPLPRLRPWRALAPVVPAAAFLAVALWLPQRIPSDASTELLADELAADLTATLIELKQQELVTPDEEARLEEEIERIRRDAKERMDPSTWEAADALRERVAADLSAKQDAMQWAEAALERYAAAAESGAGPQAQSAAAELTQALDVLAKSGLLDGAAADLQKLLKSGKLPADPAALRQLSAAVSQYLEGTNQRVRDAARLGQAFGRFDPREFGLESDQGVPGGNIPGRGGIDRGRADAGLTYGKETTPHDRFKAQALPPGAARSADDWTPLAVMPGTPQESARLSTAGRARQYEAAAGLSAWRRTLAPRHQRAVKRYFEK